ncbi:MAG: porin [Planctomycetota bacterium]
MIDVALLAALLSAAAEAERSEKSTPAQILDFSDPRPLGEWRDWSAEFGGRGLILEHDSGLELRLGGRVHYDVARFDDEVLRFADDAGFRRLRGYLTARYDDWGLRLDNDFGGTVEGWKSVYLRYYGLDSARVTLGNQVTPFSMEQSTSSNAIPFLERSIANALATGLNMGLAVSTRGDNWSAATGFFNDPLDSNAKKRSAGSGLVGRATWAPVLESDGVVHLGASLERRDVDPGSRFRIRARPESGLANNRLVNTRSITDVDSTSTYGLEAATRYGPLTVQAEYLRTDVDRESTDVDFDGWYVQANYMLTGETRRYRRSRGSFAVIDPQSDYGALEVGLRLSALDLNDEDIDGGEEQNVTLGLNWYWSRNVRFMANYVRAEAEPNQDGADDQVDILQFRAQVTL